jgi:tetratricopeptide (TPR) repeat protein
MRRTAAATALIALLLPWFAFGQARNLSLRAEPENPAYATAKSQLEQGDFEGAVRTLNDGLTQQDVTDEQLADMYQLLGLAELYLGDQDAARDAFEKLLQARPDYELPRSEPPKIRQLYARIKEDIKHRRVLPVTLEVAPVGSATGGQPLTVHADVQNLALGARPKLYYRRAGSQAFGSLDFQKEHGSREKFDATLPATEVPSESHPYEIEYYVEVADAAERRLAGKGDAFNPLRFRVEPPANLSTEAVAEESPWYKNPWVWVVGGAVTVGAGVGIAVLATRHQTGTLNITIVVK